MKQPEPSPKRRSGLHKTGKASPNRRSRHRGTWKASPKRNPSPCGRVKRHRNVYPAFHRGETVTETENPRPPRRRSVTEPAICRRRRGGSVSETETMSGGEWEALPKRQRRWRRSAEASPRRRSARVAAGKASPKRRRRPAERGNHHQNGEVAARRAARL